MANLNTAAHDDELTSAQIFEYDYRYGEPLIIEFIGRCTEQMGRTLDQEIMDSMDKSDRTDVLGNSGVGERCTPR